MTQANIANQLGRLGRFKEAETQQRFVFKQREMKLGKEHAHTLCSMNKLAIVLSDRGKHQEALDMHQEAWDARRKSLGDEHVHTIASLDNMAVILIRMGRIQDAIHKHRNALQQRMRLLKPGDEGKDTQLILQFLLSGKGVRLMIVSMR